MKATLLLLALTGTTFAQEPVELFAIPCTARTLYSVSECAMIAATVADHVSSRGLYERNPLLGRGPYGTRQALTGTVVTVGGTLLLRWMVHKWPRAARVASWINFAGVAGHTAAAVNNLQVQTR